MHWKVKIQQKIGQVRPQRDLRSVGPQQQIAGKASQDAKKDFPRLVTMSSNTINHQRENSVDSCGSGDEDGYDNLSPISVEIHRNPCNLFLYAVYAVALRT